jgi:hypothetical protein
LTDDDTARRARAALIDTTQPNPSRVGDYLAGGRNNFEADRKVARAMVAAAPVVGAIAPATIAFHRRAVRYLVAEAGIRQFLRLGTGLTSSGGNTHDFAQAIDPRCRIVYMDTDPVVLAHARALMRSTPEGAIGCLEACASKPAALLAGASETLDFGQPVAFMLLATLAFIPDIGAARALVDALLGAAPSGSYLAVYHQASDLDPAFELAARRWNKEAPNRVTLRSRDEVAGLLAGLDLVPPGLVPIADWRPASGEPAPGDPLVPFYAAVGRKP